MVLSLSDSPSSSASNPRCYSYDVFLNFRGEDTRKGIIYHLYDKLEKAGSIKTFKDDVKLKIGNPISNILKAIGESRLVIVVLSQNYASSTFCLEELVHAFHCMEGKDSILPLFYNVDPSDVRKQRGKFGEDLCEHERSPNKDKVKQWKIALTKVSNLSGWDTRNFRTDGELIQTIVEFVCSKLSDEVSPRPAESIQGRKEPFIATPFGDGNLASIWVGAKYLEITHSALPQHWKWKSIPESRFPEVAYLIKVNYFKIEGLIETNMLCPETPYAAFLVYRFQENTITGFRGRPIELSVTKGGHTVKKTVLLDSLGDAKPKRRADGYWLEMQLDDSIFNKGDNASVDFCLFNDDNIKQKSGLIVEGIELRPRG